jgi:hypothetical protein
MRPQHSIQPYCFGVKYELIEASTSNCRAAYNLYIGLIMNQEACFSPRTDEVKCDLYSISIGEEVEYTYGAETEFSVTTAALMHQGKSLNYSD